MFEIDKRVGAPNLAADLLPSHQFAGVVDEQGEDLERLRRQVQEDAGFAEFSSQDIKLKTSETYPGGSRVGLGHRTPIPDYTRSRIGPEALSQPRQQRRRPLE